MRVAFKNIGFTLIELLITLAIGAVLMTLAAPSFMSFLRNSELNSATNTLLAGINAARGEALKRGVSAMVVPTGNGNDWGAGWVIFIDTDRNQAFTDGVDQVIGRQIGLPSYFTIATNGTAAMNPPYILFDASGYPINKTGGFSNATFSISRNDVSSTQVLSETRRLIIWQTGRIRTCKPKSATDADCSTGSSS